MSADPTSHVAAVVQIIIDVGFPAVALFAFAVIVSTMWENRK